MARLIDADKLPYENQVISYDDEWCLKVSDIENAPTVDAVEVVHGRWIKKEEKDRPFSVLLPHCSECGAFKVRDTENYCHNCGAKMDGDGNGTA